MLLLFLTREVSIKKMTYRKKVFYCGMTAWLDLVKVYRHISALKSFREQWHQNADFFKLNIIIYRRHYHCGQFTLLLNNEAFVSVRVDLSPARLYIYLMRVF